MSHAIQRIIPGFIAGAVSVLTFHQGIIGTFHVLRLISFAPFPSGLMGPLHVPFVFDLAFWGGCWGALFGLVAPRLPGSRLAQGVGLGLIAAATSWFVVAPLKGAPVADGGHVHALVMSAIINGFWGIGVVLILDAIAGRGGAVARR
ncbi:MAG: hypothetical protein ACREF3_18240 [Acetobacteraceae bacterium]